MIGLGGVHMVQGIINPKGEIITMDDHASWFQNNIKECSELLRSETYFWAMANGWILFRETCNRFSVDFYWDNITNKGIFNAFYKQVLDFHRDIGLEWVEVSDTGKFRAYEIEEFLDIHRKGYNPFKT